MKVFVQIIDKKLGSCQSISIDEPVQKGFEVMNAIKHLGPDTCDIEWDINNEEYKFGRIKETTKVITAVCIQVVSDQPSRPGENRSVIGASS